MSKILILLILSGTFTPVIQSPGAELKEASYYLTARFSQSRLEYKGRLAFAPLDQPDENYPTIMVDPTKTFQTIEGFGGAFTDAASVTFSRLSPEKKKEYLIASFDPVKGNGYTLCRTTIESCDYSDESYSYDPVEGDKELKYFTIEHEKKDRIPFIKAAQKVANNGIKLFGSPWSPPAWMKSNNDMLHGGKLKPEYNQTWADFFVKYLKAFENEGIPVWGITVQNEPMAVQIWESCIFTAEEERDFVKNYLGPTLKKNDLSNVKLMIWDHNRGIMYQRAQVVYDDPETSKYVWGTGFHWYVGNHYDNVRLVHDAYPDKHLIYTEAGMGRGTLDDPEKLNEWDTSERLAKSMILDLNNWTEGWVFWNLLLDETGGPCHVGCHGFSPIMYDSRKDELVYLNTYYVFGHFSRFIKPGAKRIIAASNDDNLLATAFLNPDGKVAVVILNVGNKETLFQIWTDKKAVKAIMPSQSIVTVIFNN